MPEWLVPLLAAAVSSLITGIAGVRIGARTDRREMLAAAKADSHAMIDQLQEERNQVEAKLGKEIGDGAAKVERLEKRIDIFYADKHASRLYVAALLDHIWQRKQPPPPDPPAGYVP